MVLGKQFLSEGQSSESVGEAQERASQSALEMIANADPSGPHIPIPPLASTTTCPLQSAGEGAEATLTIGEVKGRLLPGKSEGEMGTTSDDKGEDSGYIGRAAQSEDTRSHNSQDDKERGNSQLQTGKLHTSLGQIPQDSTLYHALNSWYRIAKKVRMALLMVPEFNQKSVDQVNCRSLIV